MLPTQLALLTGDDGPGDGTAEALDLVARFDDALGHGLARLGEAQTAALAGLAAAVTATPLGDRVGTAVEKIRAGSVGEEHLAALAGARAAVLGAVHDALLDRFDVACGRSRDAWPPAAGGAAGGPAEPNLLAASRSWLGELAIAGWRGVDADLTAGADQTVQGLWAAPGLRRLAVLLDGLASELRASAPVATMACLPARRWADLWTRAVLLSQTTAWPGDGGPGGAAPVSGRLLLLGADVHEHGTAMQVQVHGLLEPGDGGPARLVRASVGAAKVETIVGPALWRLLEGSPVLLAALAGRHGLDVADMPSLPGGDLLWDDTRARPGEPADPFTTARVGLSAAVAPPVPPLERHPVRIAEPVLLEGYTATAGDDGGVTLDLGGGALPVDVDRLPGCGPLTPELVAASSACLGLLRWDGRWVVAPFAVQSTVKRRTVAVHTGDWALGPTDPRVVKAEARAGDAVAVLRERAGRLLRK